MKRLKWLHKWLSPLVGSQLLIWLSTGLFFNLIGHQWGAGNDYRHSNDLWQPCVLPPVSINALDLPFQPIKIELINLAGSCYYLVHRTQIFHQYQTFDGIRFNANSGVASNFVTEEEAQAIAIATYNGPGMLTNSTFFAAGESPDHKQQNPLWQLSFDDELKTRVYVHGISGLVTHHDNSRSEIRKLMLKLHFMDYFNTGRFNTPLLIIFALMSLMLTASGIFWLTDKAFRKRAS